MRIMNRLRSFLLCILSVFLIGSSFVPAYAEPEITPPEISSEETMVWIPVGGSKQLTYKIDVGSPDTPVVWKIDSDDTGELSVDKNGIVTAGNMYGRAYIRGVVPGGDAVLYTVYVYENPNQLYTPFNTYYLECNETKEVYFISDPDGGRFSKKTAQVVVPSIASVTSEPFGDDHVEITAGSTPGQTDVIVTSANGVYAVFRVIVTDQHIANKIKSEQERFWLEPRTIKSRNLYYELEPADSIDQVQWQMLYTENNCVYFEDEVPPTIWATKNIGYAWFAAVGYRTSLNCYAYISDIAESIYPDQWSYTVPVGGDITIPLNTSPSTAAYCRKYVLNDYPELFEVTNVDLLNDYTGMNYLNIHGVSAGSGTVTVQIDNGDSIGITINVIDIPAMSINSDIRDVYIVNGDYYQLPYQLYPAETTEIPRFGFVGAPSDIITITETGGVVANRPGMTNIYAEIANGDRVYYVVYVYDDPLLIEFDHESYAISDGQTERLGFTLYPENASFARFHAESSDSSIVSINNPDVSIDFVEVYGIAEGVATITLTADNGLKATATVTVGNPTATDISIVGDQVVKVAPGASKQLEYALTPAGIDEKPVFEIISSENDCFTVDENGVVTGLPGRFGYGYVRASIGSGNFVQWTVYVTDEVNTIDFDQDVYNIPINSYINFANYMLFSPATSRYAELTATSSDTNVVTAVSNEYGVFLAGIQSGTATVTVTAKNGDQCSATVNVLDGYARTVMTTDYADIYLKKGNTRYLDYRFDNTTGNYSREKGIPEMVITHGKNVVSIDDMAMVTALDYGYAIAEVRSVLYNSEHTDPYRYKRSYNIYVAEDPVSLAFPQDSYSLERYSTGQFKVITDSPQSQYCKKTYTSDSNILIVDEDGWYSALDEGVAHVTCTASNGVSATVTVEIGAAVSDMGVSVKTGLPIILNKTETFDLKTVLTDFSGNTLPAADLKKIRYESFDSNVVKVQNGIITGISKGITEIRLYSSTTGKIYQTIPVCVTEPVTAVSFKTSSYKLMAGDEIDLKKLLYVSPSGTLPSDLQFETSNADVALIVRNGNVYKLFGNRPGTARITARLGSGSSAIMNVTIGSREAMTSLNRDSSSPLFVYKNYRIRPDIKVLGEFNDQLKYDLESSDPEIAAVRYNSSYNIGPEIEGISPGTATITARLKTNPSEYVKFPVVVSNGDADTYQYGTSLVRLKGSQYDYVPAGANQEEYTVYAGSSYMLNVFALWNLQDNIQYPSVMPGYDGLSYTATNSCIDEMILSRGYMSGTSGLYEHLGVLSFMAVRPGDVTVNIIGNRTITIHVAENVLRTDLKLPENVIAGRYTAFSAEADGGNEPYNYKFTVKVNGKWENIENPDNKAEVSYIFTEGGSYPVCVTVTDADGNTVKSQKTLTVKNKEPLSADLILPASAVTDSKTKLQASVTGGIEPFTYKFTVKVNGSWKTISNPQNKAEVSYTFTEAGSYPVCVTVTDAAGKTDKSQKTLTVSKKKPLSADLILPSPAYAGIDTKLQAEVAGGVEPYTYKFTVKVNGSWETIKNPDNKAVVSYVFAKAGSYPVSVTVKDAEGTSIKSQKTLIVKEIEPLAVDLVLPSTAYAGMETRLKAEAAGGVEPYTYKFTVKVNGSWETAANPENKAEVSYVFAEAGSYPVSVTVKDKEGTSKKSQKTITVIPQEPLAGELIFEEEIRPGSETEISVNASGGSGNYEYRFDIKANGKWTTVKNYSSDNTIEYTFAKSGLYPVCAYIRDISTGETIKVQETAYAANDLTLTLNPVASAKVGKAVTLEAAASGGVEPYKFKFTVKEGGSWVTKRGYLQDNTYNWTPSASGNIPVCVYVKDAGGKIIKHQVKILVSPAE